MLAFIGKFAATEAPLALNWVEAETVRFARRLLRPFTPAELAAHLRVTDQHARRILHSMVDQQVLEVANGQERYRTYMLRT